MDICGSQYGGNFSVSVSLLGSVLFIFSLNFFFLPLCLFSCGNNKPNSNRGFQPELSISTFELDGYVLFGSSSSSSTKKLLHSSSVYALDALFLYGDKLRSKNEAYPSSSLSEDAIEVRDPVISCHVSFLSFCFHFFSRENRPHNGYVQSLLWRFFLLQSP